MKLLIAAPALIEKDGIDSMITRSLALGLSEHARRMYTLTPVTAEERIRP
jgi:hypothetical protein